MVVLVFAVDAESNHNLVQEPVFTIFLTLCVEILTGMENQLVFTCNKILSLQKRLLTAAIRICDRACYCIAMSMAKKVNTNQGPGAAIGEIKYMCR